MFHDSSNIFVFIWGLVCLVLVCCRFVGFCCFFFWVSWNTGLSSACSIYVIVATSLRRIKYICRTPYLWWLFCSVINLLVVLCLYALIICTSSQLSSYVLCRLITFLPVSHLTRVICFFLFEQDKKYTSEKMVA